MILSNPCSFLAETWLDLLPLPGTERVNVRTSHLLHGLGLLSNTGLYIYSLFATVLSIHSFTYVNIYQYIYWGTWQSSTAFYFLFLFLGHGYACQKCLMTKNTLPLWSAKRKTSSPKLVSVNCTIAERQRWLPANFVAASHVEWFLNAQSTAKIISGQNTSSPHQKW